MRNRSIRNQQGSLQGTGADTAGREQSDGRTGAYDRYGRNCAGAGRDGKHREKTDLVIEVETDNSVESGAQEIQPDPEKTEDEKPQEPPVLAEDADVTNPDTKPAYEEEPEKKPENPTPPVDDTPKTGDTKDGMVYVEGFGWLPDEGAGSGTAADDMYENGNKVGIMD